MESFKYSVKIESSYFAAGTKGSSIMKTAAFATLARTLLSLIPSGAIVAEVADESNAGNLPWTRQVLFGKSSCTATESTVAVFLCDESGLQVRTRKQDLLRRKPCMRR